MEKQIQLEATSPNHSGTVSVRFTYPREMQNVFNIMFNKIKIIPIVVKSKIVDDYVTIKFKCQQIELNIFTDMLNIINLNIKEVKQNRLYLN